MPKKPILKTLGLAVMASGALFSVNACTPTIARDSTAKHIASPALMVERHISARPFVITAFERAHKRHAPATVYIEGDGLNWISRTQKSLDPTPTNPVALHLASMDKSKNVIYLARPCQYSKLTDTSKPCPNKYWTGEKYAPEVIAAMDQALENVKHTYNITEFNLVGYSGGANIAAYLAERRNDVASLRTVAGNLNHRLHSEVHQVSYLKPVSLNAVNIAPALADMPQRHFIGGQDEIVPPAIVHSFTEAVGSDKCIHETFIQEAEHEEGWVKKWPELLRQPVACKGPLMKKETIMVEPAEIKRVKRERPVKP